MNDPKNPIGLELKLAKAFSGRFHRINALDLLILASSPENLRDWLEANPLWQEIFSELRGMAKGDQFLSEAKREWAAFKLEPPFSTEADHEL